MIPQGRTFYLEAAKATVNRELRIMYFKNYVRILNKK